MANATNGKVVSLGDHPRARSRLSPQESAGVVRDCRELALTRIVASLSGMMDRIEDDLFELAEKTHDREAQNVYLDARASARENRPLIEASFRSHFIELFNRKVRGEPMAPGSNAAGAPSSELSLVNDEELEGTLQASDMARKLSNQCEAELYALSQRFGFLLERPEMKDDANPLSPATVCAALKDACDKIDTGFKVRMALLKQFEGYVAVDLQRVYHDLNAHLVQRQILPEIRPVARKNPRGPQAANTGRGPGAAPGGSGGAAASGSDTTGPNSDIFQTLAKFLGTPQGGGAAPAGGMPAGAGAVGATGFSGGGGGFAGGGGGGGAAGMAGFPAILGGISGTAGTPGTPGSAVTVPPTFLAELTRMHHIVAETDAPIGELVNVLRNLRASAQVAALPTVDATTIDIVAMLFDYIFVDEDIPGNVKAMLGRLQIPLLKVAMLDKAFFSAKQHPARRLVDCMAEAAIGLDERSAKGEATVRTIERTVQRVLDEFDTDIGLFETLRSDVEAFLQEQKRHEEVVVERSARYIEERERQEIARLTAEDEIARRLETRVWVPPAVRGMLTTTWVKAMAHVHLNEGEGSPPWQQLVLTMEDLLWSVEPKAQSDDRKRLVTMLPGMLKNVQTGLLRAEVTEEGRDVFLGQLVDCHAAAVKAGLRGLAAMPPGAADPEPDIPTPPSIERSVVPAGDMQVDEIRLKKTRVKGEVRNVFTRTGVWTNLARGTWVEFRNGDSVPVRARLTWISPQKGVYLFTNALGVGNAISISPEALAEQLRRGEARLLDSAPLVDRAVDSMLANLRAA
ncbi:hypothetical protein DSM104443_04225 [Usitatibacter rugosus]|uniref:DUF1631 domain-containing protein n=1 Tax=Usitatibacter rugosus TaxID=2732067 RepID=A0A6M4H0V7_9PROT|nr:DUF1631 domain-containing protein [Usitatibacter rugosus]QJR13131.1 hypothetical protein DSM104443_04225 [Usitatibacter rugosus]